MEAPASDGQPTLSARSWAYTARWSDGVLSSKGLLATVHDVEGVAGRGAMKKTINQVAGLYVGVPDGWMSPAIRVGDLVFTKGFIGVDPNTGKLPESIEEQVRLIFQHIKNSLEAHGASLEDVVQMTMFFTDRKAQWPVLEKVRREIFKKDPPVTTGVGTTQLSMDASVELDAVAVITRST